MAPMLFTLCGAVSSAGPAAPAARQSRLRSPCLLVGVTATLPALAFGNMQ